MRHPGRASDPGPDDEPHFRGTLVIAREVAERSLTFRPIRHYWRTEPTSGKRSVSRAAELGLALKPWKIARVGDEEPIDIAGYVVRPGRTTIRASIFLHARRSFRAHERRPNLTTARRACAYWGWLVHADTTGFIDANRAAETHRSARQLISAADRSHL